MIHPSLQASPRAKPSAGRPGRYAGEPPGRLRDPEARLEEAVGLTQAIGLEVAGRRVVRLTKVRPATLLGKGSVEDLAHLVEQERIGVAVVDAALTPIQQRNLELTLHCKVIDRTGLILEIFGERARTKEGQLQVELAALTYQRSRLVRSWTHLERQRGGFGFLGGPGESQLEMDRRLITDRITRIKSDLEQVVRTRSLHRKARKRVPFPVVALVGYTNAGKSTLFNRLTGSEVFARDLLFATLDPTMRRIELSGGQTVILSDTVGFISDLPTGLVAAFRATLEEVLEADLILHVRDIAHPDSEAQRADVNAVLAELGLGTVSDDGRPEGGHIEVLNKIDLLARQARDDLMARNGSASRGIPVSAVTGEGLDLLLEKVIERLAQSRRPVTLSVALSDGAALAWLYDKGCVLERRDDERAAHLKVQIDPANLARFEHRHGDAMIEKLD